MSNMPKLQFVPVAVGDAKDFASQAVYKSGSRGYRSLFKAVLDVGDGEETDLRRFQISVLMTEIGSKGQESYVSKEERTAQEKAGPLANGDQAPRLAQS